MKQARPALLSLSTTLGKKSIFIKSMMVASSLLFLGNCAYNPATGGMDTVFMSEGEEIRTGDKEKEKLIKSLPLYPEGTLTNYINELGQRLVKFSSRPDLTYTFTLIDSPDINAFTLPGGHVFIYRGLLTYMKNEAELAAVIAHEIAHTGARHAVRQHAGQVGAKTAAVTAGILTMSHSVMEATSLWASAAVSGYGRDMELEADKFGAQYLAKAGYPPNAMIEVISTLKNHERFSKLKAKEEGKALPNSIYHGVFSTHPRNDKRLKKLIKDVENQQKAITVNTDNSQFRTTLQGLYFGSGVTPSTIELNRFFHNRLRFTFLYPENWQLNRTRSSIISKDNQGNQLQLEVKRLKVKNKPAIFVRNHFPNKTLSNSKEYKINGLPAYSAVVSSPTGINQKFYVTAIFFNGRSFLFTGSISQKSAVNNKTEKAIQQHFQNAVLSFRPMYRGEKPPQQESVITYIQAKKGDTFSRLASQSAIPKYAEKQLRLLNGYYPVGEPKAGEWIKIVK